MFNRASLRGEGRRGRPTSAPGAGGGCLAAASDHQTRLGGSAGPARGLASRLGCCPGCPARPHCGACPRLEGPLCQALLQDQGAPWGLEISRPGGPRRSWQPQLVARFWPNVKTWGFIQRLCQHQGAAVAPLPGSKIIAGTH